MLLLMANQERACPSLKRLSGNWLQVTQQDAKLFVIAQNRIKIHLHESPIKTQSGFVILKALNGNKNDTAVDNDVYSYYYFIAFKLHSKSPFLFHTNLVGQYINI